MELYRGALPFLRQRRDQVLQRLEQLLPGAGDGVSPVGHRATRRVRRRRPDAGGAARDALAGGHQFTAAGQHLRHPLMQPLGQPGASRMGVIDVYRGTLQLGVPEPRGNPQVVGIAQQEHRSHVAHQHPQPVDDERPLGVTALRQPGAGHGGGREAQHQRPRVHLLRWQVDLPVTEVLVRAEAQLSELRGLAPQQDVPQQQVQPGTLALQVAPQDLQLRLDDRFGKVAAVRRLHVAAPVSHVEPGDDELRAAMQVDCAVVEQRLGGGQVHLSDRAPDPGALLHDHHVGGAGGTQRDVLGRVGTVRPVPAAGRVAHRPAPFQVVQQGAHFVAERRPVHRSRRRWAGVGGVQLGIGERELEQRALELIQQHVDVVGIDPAALGRTLEEVLRMADDELVDRRRRRDQERQRSAGAAPGASGLLPAPRDGAGESGQD